MKKTLCCKIILVLLFGSYINMIDSKSRIKGPIKGPIIIHSSGSGFFSNFFRALSTLRWCDKNDVVPVVHWGERSTYYEEDGHNGSYEPWEYFFEPVSDLSHEEALKTEGVIINRHYSAPDKTFIQSTNCNARGYKKILERDYRRSLNKVIKRYIKFKPSITDQVDAFYKEHIEGKKTIGIHLRGTDKFTGVWPVPVERICDTANELAKEFSECQFFIASDDARLVEKAKTLLKRPVILFDAYRSPTGRKLHGSQKNYNKAKHGEELLVEVLLLSRCDKFVHTRSNVSSGVLCFNPELDNVLLYDEKNCPLM